MNAETDCYDVCVVGGGPAGASLALRLGQLGRRVALVEKAAFPRPHIGESLSPGVHPLLEVLGVNEAVAAAGFLSSTWATVAWAGEQRRYRVHGGPGLLVDRGRFDAVLLRAAAAHAGVKLYQPARVLGAERCDEAWAIVLDSGELLRAAHLAHAAGSVPLRLSPRSGAGPRRLLGARTLALYAHWELGERADVPSNNRSETLVESGREAWYWGAELPGGLFNATVFVDPRGQRQREYEALVRESQLLSARLRGCRRVSEVVVCDATPSAAAMPITPTWLRVGDAALFLDPISSQGVQTAIGTAFHAAIVLNTLIENPADAELAMGFYQRRVRDAARFHALAAAGFYGPQADVTGHDFWVRRAAAAFAAAEATPTDTQSPARPPRAAVLSPASRIACAERMVFSPIAVASASRVMRTEGVTVGDKEYAFVGRGIALAPLLAQIEAPARAFDVVERWSRALQPREALQILQWAWREGLVTSADDTAGANAPSADAQRSAAQDALLPSGPAPRP